LAKKAIANFIEKTSRLYEQERRAVSAVSTLEMYVTLWLRWVKDGLQGDNYCSSQREREKSLTATYKC
jgi:hypothetical protein